MRELVVPVPTGGMQHEESFHSYRALWARVIIKAICDYVIWEGCRTLKEKRDRKNVERWLFENNTGLGGICEQLGWPIDMVRERARTMTRDEVRKIEHREREPVRLATDGNNR